MNGCDKVPCASKPAMPRRSADLMSASHVSSRDDFENSCGGPRHTDRGRRRSRWVSGWKALRGRMGGMHCQPGPARVRWRVLTRSWPRGYRDRTGITPEIHVCAPPTRIRSSAYASRILNQGWESGSRTARFSGPRLTKNRVVKTGTICESRVSRAGRTSGPIIQAPPRNIQRNHRFGPRRGGADDSGANPQVQGLQRGVTDVTEIGLGEFAHADSGAESCDVVLRPAA